MEFEEDCWENAVKQSRRAFVSEVPCVSDKGVGSKLMSERELYKQIRIVLDLHVDSGKSWYSEEKETTESRQETNQVDLQNCAGVAQIDGLCPSVSVPQTLKAACSALGKFRQIVDECSYCKMNSGSENLYLLVHSLSLANPDGSLPGFVDKLESLFMSALSRQRIHPFPILADGEMRSGAAEILEEGQSRAF